MTTLRESRGLLDLVDGLPVHVLVNHAVIVFIPLAVVVLCVVILFPRFRQHYRFPAVALAILGAISAVLAEQSGKALQARVGYPGVHAEWGEMLTPVAIGLAVLSVIWIMVVRMASSRGKVIAAIVGGAVIVVGIIAVVITVLAGHSGVQASWAERMESTESSEQVESDSEAMGVEAVTEPTPPDLGDVLSIEVVALFSTEEKCWTVIDGDVYDLTGWITKHPGGASRILGLCGKDGTSRFQGQHAGSSSALSALEGYRIGALGDPIP